MKKKLSINFLILSIITFLIYKNSGIGLEDPTLYTKCGAVSIPTGILTISSAAVTTMQIIVPLAMIIFGSLDFVKALISKKNDEFQKRRKIFLKRMVLGCMTFFVFTIMKAIVGVLDDDTDYTSCLSCAFNGVEECGGNVDTPFTFDFPEQVTIYDSDVGFVTPPLRDDAYQDKNNENGTATGSGSDIVEYAKKYAGLVYVYGGNSLISGVDCSGFTSQIFKHFGIELPRTAHDQSSVGEKVNSLSEAQPGDLLFFDWQGDGHYDHVAIYMGNNQKIHASGSPSCHGKTATGCQVKIDTNSFAKVGKIRRVK